jgi:predicted aminopeptidase
MNSEIIEKTTDKTVEKMAQALRYAEGLRFYSTHKISPLPKPDSMRVISQIKREKLIG